MKSRSTGVPAMKASRPAVPRPSLLAIALAAGMAAASPAFALGCVSERDGTRIVLSRNPLEAPDSRSYFGFGRSAISVPFDATGYTRIELRGCDLDSIEHGTLVSGTPIEIIVDNGPTLAQVRSRDLMIDLRRLSVNQASGGNLRNRIVVNGGRLLSTTGPAGNVPLDVVFNGGAFGGAGSLLRFNVAGTVRDDDTLTVNGGVLDNSIMLGGGNDSARFTNGDASSALFTLFGDGGTYTRDTLNAAGNRFDDTFTLTGGRVHTIHGDSGDSQATRDGTGAYTGDGGPGGNDRFILDGGWARHLIGDDGDDRLDLRGTSSLYEFRGGYGSDTVDVAAGANLANVFNFDGDSRGGGITGTRGRRDSDVDTIRFRGQQLRAQSDADGLCGSGERDCVNSVRIRGFERIELLEGTRLTIHEREPRAGAALGDLLDAATTSVFIDPTSWLIARRTTDTLSSAPRVRGSVQNEGIVDLGQDATGDVLEVQGNWSGTGRVLMSTVFAGDDSATDRLRILGNATGRTVLDITQAAGSTGARTVDGILVVDTRGTSTADAFVLAAPITTANGLWQYRLERASSGVHAGRFVLVSTVPAANPPSPPPPSPPPTNPPPPGTTPPPVTPPVDATTRLLAPVVVGGAMSGIVARDLFVDGLATAGQRATAVRDGSPAWLQVTGDRLETHGERLGSDMRRIGLQAGIDLLATDAVTRGVAVRVARADGHAQDHLRPTLSGFASALSADVARLRTQAATLAAYQSNRLASGWMFDTALEAGALRSRFQPDRLQQVTADGWGAALHGAVSRGFAIGGWDIVPQARLTAAHTRLDGLNGSVLSERLAQDTLRARIGAQATTRGTSRLFAGLHVTRDLLDADAVVFQGGGDTTRVLPDAARTWGDVSLGFTHDAGPLTWHIRLHGEFALGEGHRSNAGAQAGLAWRW